MKQHNLLIDKAHIEVYYYAKSGLPTVNDKRREDIIKNTCETVLLNVLYPRSAILVQIFEMEDCGGVNLKTLILKILIVINDLVQNFSYWPLQ